MENFFNFFKRFILYFSSYIKDFKFSLQQLSPVHTKNDNYKDNDISVHTSERYRLFILSARVSATLNFQARHSRMDSDWLSMFVSFISWKKSFWKWFQRYRFSVPLSL